MKMFRHGVVPFALLFVLQAPLALAQDIYFEDLSAEEQALFLETFENAEGLQQGLPGEQPVSPERASVASCFDYYQFNSVHVDIAPTVAATVPGSSTTFTGRITNTNAYPVVNAVVYVKLFRVADSEKNANGQDVIDQFIAVRDITLDANEAQEILFTWDVPSFLSAGEYQAATYVISNYRYNMLGLSFTDDIVGGVTNFSVVSENTTGVSFAKDGTTVGGTQYLFATFPPRFTTEEQVPIVSTIANTTDVDVTVPVSLALYAWDAINPDQYVRKETKTVTVPANSTATVSFTVPENQEPVYLAELSLRYRDVKSYLNVRFVRDGIDKIRINFPSIGTYPLRAGEPVEVFMCMHNMADTMVGATAQLTVFDEDGEVLHTYKEDTYVHGDMGAVVSSFVPKADHATFSVLAEILVGGVVVASDTMRYECDQFGTCVEEAEPMFFDTLKHIALYLVALVALLIGIALLARLKKKN